MTMLLKRVSQVRILPGAPCVTALTWGFSPSGGSYSVSDDTSGAVCVSGGGVDLPHVARRISILRHGLRSGLLRVAGFGLRPGSRVLGGGAGARYEPGRGLGDRQVRRRELMACALRARKLRRPLLREMRRAIDFTPCGLSLKVPPTITGTRRSGVPGPAGRRHSLDLGGKIIDHLA